MTAAFALSVAVWGLVALAIYFSGADTYAAIARENGFAETWFYLPAEDPAPAPQRVGLPVLVGWHERWVAYVLGRSSDPPQSRGQQVFTAAEARHMADVRNVFIGAQALMYAAGVAAIVLVGVALRSGVRTAGLLLRDGGLAAAAVVLAVGVVAAVAFDPAFLAFHYVFFPQGNFLFPPTSNLLRLYPEAYWYAVTLRVGGAFIAVAVVIALIGWLMSRSGIVTRR